MAGSIFTSLVIISGGCDPAEADDALWGLIIVVAVAMAWGTLMGWFATRVVRRPPHSSDAKEGGDARP